MRNDGWYKYFLIGRETLEIQLHHSKMWTTDNCQTLKQELNDFQMIFTGIFSTVVVSETAWYEMVEMKMYTPFQQQSVWKNIEFVNRCEPFKDEGMFWCLGEWV
jgi:hypothetical protein